MKVIIILLAFLMFALSFECPHDLEVRCNDEVNRAYPVCEKAAH